MTPQLKSPSFKLPSSDSPTSTALQNASEAKNHDLFSQPEGRQLFQNGEVLPFSESMKNVAPSNIQGTPSQSPVQILEVNTAKLLTDFIELPWRIYQNDPCWIAPLKPEVRKLLDPNRHPFYQHGWVKKFVARQKNHVVGRILVADDPRFNEENGTNVGNFGFFESIDDQNVANALLDTAQHTLQQRGLDTLFGPVEYSTNYSCGILINGFETPAKVMMPYNPPYYDRLLQHWGMQKNRDLYSWRFDGSNDLLALWRDKIEKLNQRHHVTIRSFRMNHFQEDVKRCMDVYDHFRKSWWWACVSLTSSEIEYYAKMLRTIARERHILLAEVDGKTVGFSITVPDLNEAIAPLNGSLTWFGIPYLGLVRLFRRLKNVRSARMMVLCVLPEYQRRGIAERLILETFDYGKNIVHYTNAELGWTDETNDKVNRIIERVGAKKSKVYRVYQRKIA